MTLKKSVLTSLLLIACFAALAAACGPARAQEAENAEVSRMTAEELSATCKALSQSDAEGRIYRPITGKFLQDKSRNNVVKVRSGSSRSTTIALARTKDVIAYIYSVKMNENFYKTYYQDKLRLYTTDDLSNETLGMCIYSNASGQLMDRISTLTIITDE